MEFLATERQTLATHLPGLDEALAATPLAELESPESPSIRLFREAGGPALLIPRDYSGLGASPLEAVRVQRALGSRSPSLAVASTMHHFSTACLVAVAAASSGLEWLLLEAIAQQRLLLASGFAEGQPGRGILSPTMELRLDGSAYVVSGCKKPCSLSRSMDFLTASALLPARAERGPELAVVLVPAASPGLERRAFWANPVLAGAESDEVVLRDVQVPPELVFPAGSPDRPDPLQIDGFLWFELLISAAYLGVASALVERVLRGERGEPGERTSLGIEMEGAMAAIEGLARGMAEGQRGEDELARALFVRYAVQRAIERATAQAAELLGGMAFVGSSDVSYLFAAARALAFHPPSRPAMASALAEHLTGGSLRIQ